MPRDIVDYDILKRSRHIMLWGVVRQILQCVVVEDILRQPSGEVLSRRRFKYRSLGGKFFLSRALSEEQGPTVKTLHGPVQLRESLT